MYDLDIEEVISKFCFEKVYITMKTLDWNWSIEGSKYVPTIIQLKDTARKLLRKAVESKVCSTGGFTAKFHPAVDDEPEYFELYFILEEADSFV